jgi:hypothetical protein
VVGDAPPDNLVVLDDENLGHQRELAPPPRAQGSAAGDEVVTKW